MNRALGFALLAALLVSSCIGTRRAEPRLTGTPVAVRLAHDADLAPLEGSPGLSWTTPGRTRPVTTRTIRLTAIAGSLAVDGVAVEARVLTVAPVPGGHLAYDGRRYRGEFEVRLDDDARTLTLFNRLPVEEYLLGVLPREMPDAFGQEALRAQAVAARTYALSEMSDRGWLHPDARSQVYGGRDAETSHARRAVSATAHQVLMAGGALIPAFFHSTCGGATTPAKEVFPGAPAAVMDRVVACTGCARSPMFAWERRFDADAVCAAAGLPPAPLRRVVATPVGTGARVETVEVEAGDRSARVDAATFRARLSRGRGLDAQLLSLHWSTPPWIEDGRLVVSGRGWGHGVGLCQYGARGYADAGASFRTILRRYYPGATLVTLAEPSGS